MDRIKINVLLCIICCLSGCSYGPSKTEMTRQALQSMVGKNKQIAFDVLGYPSIQRNFDGTIVYVWQNHYWVSSIHNQPTTKQGVLNGKTFFVNDVVPVPVTQKHTCEIQLVTSAQGKITHYDLNWRGYNACDKYLHRLQHYLQTAHE